MAEACREKLLAGAFGFIEMFPDADIVVIVTTHSTDSGSILYDECIESDEVATYAASMSKVLRTYLGRFWDEVLVGYRRPESRRILLNLACGSVANQERSRADLHAIVTRFAYTFSCFVSVLKLGAPAVPQLMSWSHLRGRQFNPHLWFHQSLICCIHIYSSNRASMRQFWRVLGTL